MIKNIVTVIVPVYNSEKYLSQCIDSVLKQTFQNFELLLINDGSKDRSGEICEAYAAKDHRIRVIHQKNAGVSAARNCGLDKATSEYIMFVDSDDYIDAILLENAYSAIMQYGIDLYICGMETVSFINGKIVSQEIYAAKGKRICTTKDVLENMDVFYPRQYIFGPCHKVFSRNIIEEGNIRFHCDLTLGEDFLFNQCVLRKTQKVYLSDEIHYFYRMENTESLTHRFTPQYYEMTTFVNDQMRTLMERFHCSEKSRNHFEFVYFSALLHGITTCYLDNYERTTVRDRLNIISKVSKNTYIRRLQLKEVETRKQKLLLLLLKLRMTGLIALLMKVRFRKGSFGL